MISDDFAFYSRLSFLKKELYRLWVCRRKGAFQLNADFFRGSKDPRESNAYGETPLRVMDIIARITGLHSGDVFYDLGSSTGRTSFFLNEFYGCNVIGIELNSELFNNAKKVLNKFPNPRVTFREANYFEIDYSEATVVYLFSTCVTDIGMLDFAKALATARKGTKIITVSKSLMNLQCNPDSDEANAKISQFKLLAEKLLPYIFGYITVYFHEKI